MREPRLFATLSTSDLNALSYWRRSRTGALVAWPPGTRYGPVLLEKDIPLGLPRHERRDYKLNWYTATVVPWLRHAHAAVEAEPLAAAARFAAWTSRCLCCARRLEDAHGRLAGACTGCRGRLPHDVLTALISLRH